MDQAIEAGMVDVLDTCIEEILSGRKSLQDCLLEYRDVRNDLEPLLRVAVLTARLAQDQLPAVAMARSRMRLQAKISESHRRSNAALAPRRSLAFRAAAALLVMALAGGGTSVVAASSLPNDPAYPLKLALEGVELGLAGDVEQRANLHLEFAQRRLEEIQTLQTKGVPLQNALVLDSLGNETEQGWTLAGDLPEQPRVRLAERAVVLTERQLLVLAGVVDGVTPEVRPDLMKALGASRRLHNLALAASVERSEGDREQQVEKQAVPSNSSLTPTDAPATPSPAVRAIEPVEKRELREERRERETEGDVEGGGHRETKDRSDNGRASTGEADRAESRGDVGGQERDEERPPDKPRDKVQEGPPNKQHEGVGERQSDRNQESKLERAAESSPGRGDRSRGGGDDRDREREKKDR